MKQNIKLLINKRESTRLKHFNDCKSFIEHSNNMDDIYKKIFKNTIQIGTIKFQSFMMI